MIVVQEIIQLKDKKFRPYIHRKEIKEIIKSLAARINADYKGEDLIVIGVLDGVIMVLADLVKRLDVNVTLELIKLKSYEGRSSTGRINQIFGLTKDLKGKQVLIVEDIIDSGTTLGFLLEELKKEKVRKVEIATLLIKEEVFANKFPVKYIGRSIENKFVVGYGMDYDGEGRQLPDIYHLEQD